MPIANDWIFACVASSVVSPTPLSPVRTANCDEATTTLLRFSSGVPRRMMSATQLPFCVKSSAYAGISNAALPAIAKRPKP